MPGWLTAAVKTNGRTSQHPPRHEKSGRCLEKRSHFTTLLYADALGQYLVIAGGTVAGGIMLAVSVISVRETDGIATFTMRSCYAPATGMAEFKLNFTGRLDDRLTC